MVSEIAVASPNNARATGSPGFCASDWLNYFQRNRRDRVTITCPNNIDMSEALRTPLLRSLQRFLIGETGEGKHLRKYAGSLNDPVYEQCIDLFIKEEQTHARMLAEIIAGLDGTLLSWHWTDLAFIVLRRMLGLKTEVFILLIAEIIGKCFYAQCARSLAEPALSDAFSLIAIDEIAHLQFHSQFLANQMSRYPRTARQFVCWGWRLLFSIACAVFIFDHGNTLVALGSSRKGFFRQCRKEFCRAASHLLQA